MQEKILTVIFGAGASFDCRADYHEGKPHLPRMPLIDHLFNFSADSDFRQVQERIYKTYRGAEVVANLYNTKRYAGIEIRLEDFLKKEESKSREDILNIREVPFFLREVLGGLGRHLREKFGQTHYSTLIQSLNNTEYTKIVLITLNYDLLLDWALRDSARLSLENIQAYVRSGSKWAYVKLHGSVNWVKIVEKSWLAKQLREINSFEGRTDLSGLVQIEPKRIFEPGFQYFLNEDYSYIGDNTLRYPIMVLPHAEKKEYICPKSHIDAIIPLLNHCEDFCIIGNSMQDGDIIQLTKEHAKKVRRVMIVDDFSSLISRNYWDGRLHEAFSVQPHNVEYQKIGFHEFILKLVRGDKFQFYDERLTGIRIEDERESSEEPTLELN